MGNVIYEDNPELDEDGGNTLKGYASDYQQVDMEIDFTGCLSLQHVKFRLKAMDLHGFHLIGSRDYVYSSERMLKMVEDLEEFPIGYRLLTRTGGLRDTVRRFLEESDVQQG